MIKERNNQGRITYFHRDDDCGSQRVTIRECNFKFRCPYPTLTKEPCHPPLIIATASLCCRTLTPKYTPLEAREKKTVVVFLGVGEGGREGCLGLEVEEKKWEMVHCLCFFVVDGRERERRTHGEEREGKLILS